MSGGDDVDGVEDEDGVDSAGGVSGVEDEDGVDDEDGIDSAGGVGGVHCGRCGQCERAQVSRRRCGEERGRAHADQELSHWLLIFHSSSHSHPWSYTLGEFQDRTPIYKILWIFEEC